MTSKEFIKELSIKTGKTQKELKEFADLFETAIKEVISKGENVKIFDLTIGVKDRKETTGTDFKTMEKIVIPAGKKLSIKPSKNYKDIVKQL